MNDRRFAGLLALILAGCGGGPLPSSQIDPPKASCAVPVFDDDPSYGELDPLATMVLFADPLTRESYAALDEVLGIAGREGPTRVRVVYKFIPQNEQGRLLAKGALATRELAGQTAFFRFQQHALTKVYADERSFTPEQMAVWAKECGVLEESKFIAKLRDPAYDDLLDRQRNLARKLGLEEPAAFFVNGQRVSFLPQGSIDEAVERELKKAEVRLATGSLRSQLYSQACSENDGRMAGDTRAVQSTLSSGLVIKDTEVGKGREALTGDRVSVHYTGRLKDGSVFDSSVGRGTPFEFTLGKKQVIAGWERGIVGMRVGGKRTLVVPPELGYGMRGQPPKIPPGSTLTFDVELLEVKADRE